jgi:hypothetical protein
VLKLHTALKLLTPPLQLLTPPLQLLTPPLRKQAWVGDEYDQLSMRVCNHA